MFYLGGGRYSKAFPRARRGARGAGRREKRKEKSEKLRTRGFRRAVFAFCQCLAKCGQICRTLANRIPRTGCVLPNIGKNVENLPNIGKTPEMNLKQTKTADIAMKTTIVKMTCGVLALYFICYLVLSFRGAYSTKLYITRHRYAATGLGMPTSLIWEPLMVKSTPFEMNLLGYLFAPCVYLDRRIWHEEIDAFSFFDSNQQGLPP